jgi:hypothetical protein
LLNKIEDHIRTDAGPSTLIDLGREFHSTCTSETLDAKRIDGDVATLHDVLLDEPLSFVVLEEAEVTAKVDWLLTGEEPPTATPVATPEATPVSPPEATPVSSPEATPIATPVGSVMNAAMTRRMQMGCNARHPSRRFACVVPGDPRGRRVQGIIAD